MYDWIKDIRVGTKLCLGFGLVLALTFLIVLTGWTAINSLDERGLKIESIARVKSQGRRCPVDLSNACETNWAFEYRACEVDRAKRFGAD